MKTIAQQLNVKEFPFIINDSQENEIYYERSDGYWVKREYDSQGNKIYYESSKGYWVKREYDSQGNKIYFENSKGYWVKREYDSQGNQIYFENSNGYIKDNYIEDNRPTCEGKIVEIEGKKYKLTSV